MGLPRLPDARGAGRAAACTLLTLFVAWATARAETLVLTLDPDATEIAFQVGATLHTVEGAVALRSGSLVFPEAGGPASGRIVVDAVSAETGLDSRDAEMHERVLRSAAYPEIAFSPHRVEVVRRDEHSAEIILHGAFELLGSAHPFEIPARVERVGEAGEVRATAEIRLPYLRWGLEDVSKFVFRVDDEVSLVIRAVGTLRPINPKPDPR